MMGDALTVHHIMLYSIAFKVCLQPFCLIAINPRCVNMGKSMTSGTRFTIVVTLLIGNSGLVLVIVSLLLYTLFYYFLICFLATRLTSDTPESLAHGW
jgi:hypothetical protein